MNAKWIVILQLVLFQMLSAEVRLNEIMASNLLTVCDEQGDFDDWIEIYNPSSDSIDIAGYYLSDDRSKPKKWCFPSGTPSTKIEGNGYLVVWADKDKATDGLHASFKMSDKGEAIILCNPDGYIVDLVIYPELSVDLSYGRSSENPEKWLLQTSPTPGFANTTGFKREVSSPDVIPRSGVYKKSVEVSIRPSSNVYYTLDGSDPDLESTRYTEPIPISETTVLKVRVLESGGVFSPVIARHYILSDHALPVLSLAINPDDLFDASTGIYVNYKQNGSQWERKAHLSFFESERKGFELHCGIRIQGNSSVVMPKKSFRLFFREEYGAKRLNYPLFENNPVVSFENLVLRSGYDEDLTTEKGTLLRDPLITEMWRRQGHLTSHSRFAVLYINGEFWGIYDIREKIFEGFIRDQLGWKDFDWIRYRYEYTENLTGDSNAWEKLVGFFKNTDFTDDDMIEEARKRIDLKCYTDLHAFGHCAEYRSWYYGASAFRERKPDGRWVWTIWDMDRSYEAVNWNGFSFYNDAKGIFGNNIFMRRMLENKGFRIQFLNRHTDLLNSVFEPAACIELLDSLRREIEPEIPHEIRKWEVPDKRWGDNVEYLKNFIRKRPDIVRSQLQDYFDLADPVSLTVNVENRYGKIKVNSITPSAYPWKGTYFPDVPITLTAEAREGYYFAGWSYFAGRLNTIPPAEDKVTLHPGSDLVITAKFRRTSDLKKGITAPAGAVIYNVKGQKVHESVAGQKNSAGQYHILSDKSRVANGVYILAIPNGPDNRMKNKKMVVAR